MKRSLLTISYRFPPETYPLAIRVKYFLNHLKERWEIDAVTRAPEADLDGVNIHQVSTWEPTAILQLLRRLRLSKLIDLFVWPDQFVFWVLPALLRARSLVQARSPDLIATFTMPFSTGIVGVLLKKMTGIPLVLNMNDSLTCTDMNPDYPSRLHYHMAKALEDWFIQNADAVIFVSRRNMNRVRDRQPAEHQDKFHLIRRGVRPLPEPSESPSNDSTFRIVYTGGMSGWHLHQNHLSDETPSLAKRLYNAWEDWGQYRVAKVDPHSHSPIYVGKAVRRVLENHPGWKGRIQIHIYGNTFPDDLIREVLDAHDLEDIVHVHPVIPHREALQRIQEADLLFMTLPDRPDDQPGGRISAKTYEYLMTDRPILAALPPGENAEYLSDKPGIYQTQPRGTEDMAEVISDLASRAFAGEDLSVDRSSLRPQLQSTARARSFEQVLQAVTSVASDSSTAPKPVAEG